MKQNNKILLQKDFRQFEKFLENKSLNEIKHIIVNTDFNSDLRRKIITSAGKR